MLERTRRWLPFAAALLLLLGVLGAVTAMVAKATPDEVAAREGRFALEALADAGMKDDARVAAGELALLVRAGMVHVSWTHLAVNALGLTLVAILYWRLVPPAQRTFARAGVMLALWLVSSTAGFLTSYLARAGLSCGASAGVFGLLAAVAGATWVHGAALPRRLRWLVPLALTALSLAAVLVLWATPGMDHAAHLGGWVAGLVLGLAVELVSAGRRRGT